MPPDPTILAVDAGNTAIKFQFFIGDEAGTKLVLLRQSVMENRDDAAKALLSAAKNHPVATAVVVSCARADDPELLEALLRALAPEATPRFVTPAMELPFQIHYTSGRPGADRLANAMALRALFPGRAALAVDCGTATNLVVIDANGDFAGGVILPGIRVQAESLATATAGRLPKISFENVRNLNALANSTEGALQAGIVLGHAGAIDRLVHEIEMQFPGIEKVATGGWAELLLPHTHSNLIWEQDLTLFGLRCFAGE